MSDGAIELFVNGTLMRGLALNANLDGAEFLGETRTAARYWVYSTATSTQGCSRSPPAGSR